MLIDRNLLWTFLYVGQHKTFADAATRLRVTSSAVSHQMRKLQGQLGIPLFERVGRGVKLTTDGARLFDVLLTHAGPIEDKIKGIVESKNHIRGLVRIAGPSPFGRFWLRPRLPLVMNGYPDVTLRVEFGVPSILARRLIEGDLDICILVSHTDSPSLVTERIYVETFVAVASPEYLSRNGHPRSAEEFLKHPFIAFDEDLAMHNVWCRARLGRLRPPRIRCHIGNLDEMLALVVAGLGIAVLPSYLVEEALHKREVVELEAEAIPGRKKVFASANNTIWLAWRRGTTQRAVKAVRSMLLAHTPHSHASP